MTIHSRAQLFAVLGHPIGHSLSPVMHNAAFREMDLAAVYLAFDVEPDELSAALEGLHTLGAGGVNLTIPLKEVAARILPKLDPLAKLLGAVNTVAFTADGMVGYNTDGAGFLKALEEAAGHGVKGRSLFILGSGGAGRAVAMTAAQAGAAAITLADVDAARARRVADEITALGSCQATALAADAPREPAAREADIVVQATPVGMQPEDPAPLAAGAFRPGQFAMDLVYMYPETGFLRAAHAAGARGVNGLGMLLHQGARALEIWTGQPAPVAVMKAALEAAVYGLVAR